MDSVERHLHKAAEYLGKGEEFYRKAAAEMRAAKDEGATWVQIGDALDRADSWCKRIVTWAESPANSGSHATPFGGESENNRKAAAHTKTVLREAPMEQVEQIISELPEDRRQQIAAAAGDNYAKARSDYEEGERSLTPVQRKEREAAVQSMEDHAVKVVAPFTSLSITDHIEAATEMLQELTSHNAVSAGVIQQVGAALSLLNQEYEVATAMIGLEDQL